MLQAESKQHDLGKNVLLVLLGGIVALVVARVPEYLPPPPSPKGELLVYSNVDSANVYINGKASGLTVADFAVSMGKIVSGTYLIMLEKPGYETKLDTIYIPEEKIHTIRVTLVSGKKNMHSKPRTNVPECRIPVTGGDNQTVCI